MPLVRKLKDDWNPVEANDRIKYPGGFKIGDTIYISDPTWLIKSGAAVLVDEQTGFDIPLNKNMPCPICAFTTQVLTDLQNHLLIHQQKPVQSQEIRVEEDTIGDVVIEPKLSTTLNAESKKYYCKKCIFSTDQVIKLAQHARSTHSKV